MAQHTVYTFYAELEDCKPKVWRRFEINGSKTMAELGYTIMTMFEMMGSHLFAFTYDIAAEFLKEMKADYTADQIENVLNKQGQSDLLKPMRFELPFEDTYKSDKVRWCDASEYKIKRITNSVGTTMQFEYDFGDGWCVNLTLEKCETIEIYAGDLPKVQDGERFGIIEDCGGVGGLEELTKSFKKKSGKQYKEYCEWLGVDDLDLSTFDIDDVNFRLKKLPRIFKDSYEHGYEPTKKSIDLLERKYKK